MRCGPALVATLLLGGCGGGAGRPASVIIDGDAARHEAEARDETARAFDLIGRSNWDAAEALLVKAVAADAMYGPAHNDLGLIYYARGDLYGAASEFHDAAYLMPREAAPVNNLGLAWEKGNNLVKAEKCYSAAVDLDRQNSMYAGNCAKARIELGRRDEATAELLDLVVLRDRRPEWVAWAREQLSRTPRPTTGPAAE